MFRTHRGLAPGRRAHGFTLLEVLFVTGWMGVLMAIAIPQVLATVERSRGAAAARYLAGRMAVARAQAVARSAHVALRFENDDSGVRFAVFVDGNGNGVRTTDIVSLIDPLVEPQVSLSDMFPGVAIALTADSPGSEAVQTGRTTLLSFTPSGTATSGTIHVRGRDDTQWAVRILGATARIRVLRYVTARGEWAPVL